MLYLTAACSNSSVANMAALTENLGPRRLINRNEYIRLIEQALYRLGYAGVARQLEHESGIEMQPPAATLFQERLLAGEWEGALEILPSLLQGLAASEEALRDARFLIRQQQYLEALEAGDTNTALHVLRNQLAPLAGSQHTGRLHQLAGLLLCAPPSSGDVSAKAGWTAWLGGGMAHRTTLLAQMQAALPPWLMIPEGRLEVLLEQALDTQIARCPFHNLALNASARQGLLPGQPGMPASSMAAMMMPPSISLLQDYQAGVESLPSRCIQVLEGHSDEVWHIAFSHNGTLLASGSKDKTVIIWSVRPPPAVSGLATGLIGSHHPAHTNGSSGGGSSTSALPQLVTPLHTLQGHEAPVLFLSWSPNDAYLLTVSDVTVRLWDPHTGTLRHTFTHHKEAVTCCAWLPGSDRFVTGSVDRTLALLDITGRELSRWKRAYRVQDLAVSAGGTALIIAANDKHIHILRLSDQREVTLAEATAITSIDLSADGHFLLANLQNQAVHLWQIGELEAPGSTTASTPASQTQPLLGGQQHIQQGDPMDKVATSWGMEYRQPGSGLEQGKYVVRSSFGGAAGSFVVHGSESGQVFVYHRDSGTVLLSLEGHTATVNACAWPLAVPQLLASASDDRTIRIWLAESALPGGTRTPQYYGAMPGSTPSVHSNGASGSRLFPSMPTSY